MDARAHWHDEMQSAWLYRQLAKAEPEARVAALFTELAGEAEAQARQWLPEGDPSSLRPEARARLAAALARRVGPRRIKPLLVSLKVRGLSAYGMAPPGHAMRGRLL